VTVFMVISVNRIWTSDRMLSAFNQFWYFSYSLIFFGIGKYGAVVYCVMFSVNGFPECRVVTVGCQLEAQAVEKWFCLLY